MTKSINTFVYTCDFGVHGTPEGAKKSVRWVTFRDLNMYIPGGASLLGYIEEDGENYNLRTYADAPAALSEVSLVWGLFEGEEEAVKEYVHEGAIVSRLACLGPQKAGEDEDNVFILAFRKEEARKYLAEKGYSQP